VAFDVSRYHFIASDELAQRWISLRERLGAPETTLKAYASDLNDYLRWCSSRQLDSWKGSTVETVVASNYYEDGAPGCRNGPRISG